MRDIFPKGRDSMNRTDLKRALSATANGAEMMTPKQIGQFLGKERDYVREFCRDLDRIGTGKGMMFFVGDIADKLMEQRIPG